MNTNNILIIPKDAADTKRIEKLESLGYSVLVTDSPEKVFVIEKSTPTTVCIRNGKSCNQIDLKNHSRNPNLGFSLPDWFEAVWAERIRQRNMGFDSDHDDNHSMGELTNAAISYADVAASQIATFGLGSTYGPSDEWPWELEAWNPSDNPEINLIKSISLLVAELERMKRTNQTTPKNKSNPIPPPR